MSEHNRVVAYVTSRNGNYFLRESDIKAQCDEIVAKYYRSDNGELTLMGQTEHPGDPTVRATDYLERRRRFEERIAQDNTPCDYMDPYTERVCGVPYKEHGVTSTALHTFMLPSDTAVVGANSTLDSTPWDEEC